MMKAADMPRSRTFPVLLVALLALLLGVMTPASAAPTSGSGGPQTDRLSIPFSSGGVSSSGHVFAAGLDWSRPVGMLVYGDGSGEYGLANPNATYLLDADGAAGLVATARKHNMILVTPRAPGAGCPDGGGVCWYQTSSGITPTAKTQWANDFVRSIQAQYPYDDSRVVLAGYSSGAQLTTEYLGPRFGEALGVDLMVAISYGGRPILTPQFSPEFIANTPVVWDTGDQDAAWTTTSQYGVKAGEAWYRNAGFATQLHVIAGLGHGRSGQFAGIMDREITEHIPASTPPVVTEPVVQPWDTTVSPTRTGGTFSVNVPAGYSGRVYVRLSSGNYLYTTATGPTEARLTFQSQACGRTMTWTTEAPSGTARDGGSLTTSPC